jgi:hypothetical protein
MRCSSLVLFTLPLWSACYTYAPAEVSLVPSGAPVRARITSNEAARIGPLIGREQRVLDGALIAAAADSLVLEVPSTAQAGTGGGVRVLYQRVALPRTEVTEIEFKRLSRTRTGVVVAGGAVVLGYILLDALDIGIGKEGSRGGDTAPEFRVPLLSFPR